MNRCLEAYTTSIVSQHDAATAGIIAPFTGSQKHVVERYRLIENGTRLSVVFMLEDPEYLVEPMTHSRELIYSPHLTLSRFDCDPEATRRFLRE